MAPASAPSTRERILAAALAGFAQRGVEATSLDSLAAEIGVRKQTILYHFRSKDDLLRSVIGHATDELGLVLSAAAVRAGDRNARLTAIVDAVFRLGARRPELLALLREVSRLGPPASGDLAAAIEPLVAQAVSALETVGLDRARSRRVLLTAGAKVIGMATEVEVLRDLGVEPDLPSLRRRHRELLGYVRAELA
ncbi:MAG: putative TetR family transcriptional regulator [Acidimicrobiales bacterium]|nr:putative TetR family transcriptional regulator [Acidimicrobiales bacterium]